MKIAFPKETAVSEARIAITPDIIGKYKGLGASVIVEKNAGIKAGFTDNDYKAAGAMIKTGAKETCKGADVVVKINAPTAAECKHLKKNQYLIAHMDAYYNKKLIQSLAKQGVNAIALELMPRITRAQNMDILSSQNNIAGYKAVITASEELARAFPMMMTAAGTIPPVKLLVMGVGVAGLQAIATAKRLGAVVSATDVRPATKEQVESLGGQFIAVEDEEFQQAQTDGGYAKEMSAAYKKKQAALIGETIAKQDAVITTALIPGKQAPQLISAAMLKTMKYGSVVVDMAAAQGGNCHASVAGKTVIKDGVTIIGGDNLAAEVPQTTSTLFAKNALNFISQFTDEKSKSWKPDTDDDILKEVLVTHNGKIFAESLKAMWG